MDKDNEVSSETKNVALLGGSGVRRNRAPVFDNVEVAEGASVRSAVPLSVANAVAVAAGAGSSSVHGGTNVSGGAAGVAAAGSASAGVVIDLTGEDTSSSSSSSVGAPNEVPWNLRQGKKVSYAGDASSDEDESERNRLVPADGGNDNPSDSDEEVESKGNHDTSSEDEYEEDGGFVVDPVNEEDEEYTGSFKDSCESSEEEEEEESEESEGEISEVALMDVNELESQNGTRPVRSTRGSIAYNDDENSGIEDDYSEEEHELNAFGSDSNDEDASIRTSDGSSNMSDNDDDSRTNLNQKTIKQCIPYYVHK